MQAPRCAPNSLDPTLQFSKAPLKCLGREFAVVCAVHFFRRGSPIVERRRFLRREAGRCPLGPTELLHMPFLRSFILS